MRLGTRYQVFLLAAIVLGIYYPALSAGINSLDDPHIIAAYETSNGRRFADIINLGSTYYYRPLIEITYYLDNFLWGMHPRFMHLENILLHVLNMLLVFSLARQMSKVWGVKFSWVPLLSALLFAVHPINTESVIWIAGRTDPMAAVFILAAIWCLLQCLIEDKLFYLCLAMLLFVLGMLTKEIALCFLPVALLLTICWPRATRVRTIVLCLLAGFFAGSVLLVFTFQAFKRTLSLTALLKSNSGGVMADLTTVFTAIGFYIKKLVFPIPLNFAIDVVSQLYLLPGIFFILILFFCLKSRSIHAVLAAICGIFLLPALLISIKHVAWTPFAERYLYLPSAFFCIGMIFTGSALFEKVQRQSWLLPVTLCIAIGAALTTLQRNFVWHDNLTLYNDTVSKSPNFGAAHFELATALLNKRKFKEGRAELEVADRLNQRPSIRYPIKASLMAVRLKEEDYHGARDYFYRIFQNKEDADIDFLKLLNSADNGVASQTVDIAARNEIFRDIIDTYDVMYRKSHDPFYLYQSGIFAQRLGDFSMAHKYIRKTVLEAPADTHYTAAAIKWLKKMETGQ